MISRLDGSNRPRRSGRIEARKASASDIRGSSIRRWTRFLFRLAAGTTLAVFCLFVFLIVLFKWIDPPTSSVILQDSVKSILSGKERGAVRHTWVDYEDISPFALLAAVAAEDQRFPVHRGFDFREIRKAVEGAVNGRRLRGASTISQQTVKNLFLRQDRSVIRKVLEAGLTVLVEGIWGKKRILEVYLNIVQMGDGIYGIEAASRFYFKKSARNLTKEQAALLAATLPNPVRLSARRPSSYVLQRQKWILRQMHLLGGPKYLSNL